MNSLYTSTKPIEMQYRNRLGDSNLIHLGHMPNLDSFVLEIWNSPDRSYIIIPWIRSFYEPLPKQDGHRHPLRHFTLVIIGEFLVPETDTAHLESEWERYAVLDRLFAEPVLASLEMVNIALRGPDPQKLLKVTGLLGCKLPSGKLKVDVLPENTDRYSYQITSILERNRCK
ncbi:hypothetical protein BT96DRAFT_678623 [Gymnopus androsaceus JB14]|uniref:Uncharacterized protein n=1 Tax=Gymnopus androsaceus JB14 TaxID=1447944 RepID=A0A6A4HNW4_9AGAR|nr:hypothetical protein BT96DRAFT_678623 [Gymnopus androsaceus JB14]